MRYEVKNRWTGEVQFTADIDCAEDAPASVKLGLAVRWGRKNGADLIGANLIGANLRDADLRDADLRGANLRGADLRDADLRGADLIGANLREANLSDADLRGANLRGANLSYANLIGADLRDADLSYADLSDADLIGADLIGADLIGADLIGANLREANLTPIRDDLWAVLSAAPREAAGVAEALRAGKVDGSTYQGDCACLVGTIANTRHCGYTELGALQPNSDRPIERFFMGIREGDTPETNQFSALALEWTEQWIEAMRSAFGAQA